MRVCLVLFSGLPGAGKTTLAMTLHRLQQQQQQQQQQQDSDGDTEGQPRRMIDAVLELDAFMHQEKINDSTTSFSPETWRKAYAAVREAATLQLAQSLLNKEEGVAMRLVLLVDTLPYRSMRASYWKICKELSLGRVQLEEQAGKGQRGNGYAGNNLLSVVGMVEVRVNTPLEVCLERNERRAGTVQYIPPYVIRGMNDSFDRGVLAPATSLAAGDCCWSMVPRRCAGPWPVLRFVDEETCSSLPPELLAQELLQQLFSQDVTLELEEQATALLENEVARRGNVEEEEELCTLGVSSKGGGGGSGRGAWLHKADLHMRAIVRHYMENLKNSGVMQAGIGGCVSRCREEHYARAKVKFAQLQQAGYLASVCDAVVLQELLLEFELDLSLL